MLLRASWEKSKDPTFTLLTTTGPNSLGGNETYIQYLSWTPPGQAPSITHVCTIECSDDRGIAVYLQKLGLSSDPTCKKELLYTYPLEAFRDYGVDWARILDRTIRHLELKRLHYALKTKPTSPKPPSSRTPRKRAELETKRPQPSRGGDGHDQVIDVECKSVT